MDIWYILMTPFTWMLKFFYGIFQNYGIALILFTLVVKVILFPFSLKGKKSMIQMNLLSGQVQKLQKQYGKDQARYNEEVQKLYDREGVSPMGGCLWSMLPLMVMLPLYAIIRRPLKYWLGLPDAVIEAVKTAVAGAGVTVSGSYPEIGIISAFAKNPAALSAGQGVAEGAELYGINLNFLGVDLAATPTLKFWQNGLNWASIGLFLVPVLVVATSFISTRVMMKTNEMNGQAQANQQNKMMMLMSPLMMVWFSFIMPAGMGLYIICNSLFSAVQEVICGRLLRKDYQRAAEEKARREAEEKEEEKRLRREKAEQRAKEAEEARKSKGKKKEPEADEEKLTPEQREAARVGIRQYARGRAYDPDRYGGVTAYEEERIDAMVRRDTDKMDGRGKKKNKKEDQ